jgi:hypothetical protein
LEVLDVLDGEAEGLNFRELLPWWLRVREFLTEEFKGSVHVSHSSPLPITS